MVIKNNFLDIKDIYTLRKLFFENTFPWFYNHTTAVDKKDDPFNIMFTHNFFKKNNEPSKWIKYLNPLLIKINPKRILRIKANYIPRTPSIVSHPYHVDLDCKCKTAIFYINNNNGYTKFKNGEIVLSEENKLIEFDSEIEHHGTTCTNRPARVLINLNYEV